MWFSRGRTFPDSQMRYAFLQFQTELCPAPPTWIHIIERLDFVVIPFKKRRLPMFLVPPHTIVSGTDCTFVTLFAPFDPAAMTPLFINTVSKYMTPPMLFHARNQAVMELTLIGRMLQFSRTKNNKAAKKQKRQYHSSSFCLFRESQRGGCHDANIKVAHDVHIMAAIAFGHVFSKK
jgi:hypothetical protein